MKSSKSVYNYAAFIAALTCFGQAGCALETMKKASSEVSRNPELCKRALAEGYPKPEYEVEGVSYTQDWIYKKTIYEKCLEVEIMKKPQICSSVLAAGMPPPARGLSPKQHELRRMHEYFACKTFAGDILDNLDNLGSSSIVNDSSDEQYSNADYGKVASVQIENLSRPGNRAGSTAGAAVGQIAYLENSQLTITLGHRLALVF